MGTRVSGLFHDIIYSLVKVCDSVSYIKQNCSFRNFLLVMFKLPAGSEYNPGLLLSSR